jgi:hypothetical protein
LSAEAEWNESELRKAFIEEGVDPDSLVQSVLADVKRLMRESHGGDRKSLEVHSEDYQIPGFGMEETIFVGNLTKRDLMLAAGAAAFHLQKRSKDGRVEAEAKFAEGPSLQFEVRAIDESLRGSTVICGMRSVRTGEIFYQAEFPLQFDNGLTGKWEVALKELSEELKSGDAEIFVLSPGERDV